MAEPPVAREEAEVQTGNLPVQATETKTTTAVNNSEPATFPAQPVAEPAESEIYTAETAPAVQKSATTEIAPTEPEPAETSTITSEIAEPAAVQKSGTSETAPTKPKVATLAELATYVTESVPAPAEAQIASPVVVQKPATGEFAEPAQPTAVFVQTTKVEHFMGTSTANVVEILALLILLQSVSSICNGDNFNGSCIRTEREALVKFKSSLLNNSNSLPSWVGDDCCRWHGVTCDDITGHVVKLVLSRASKLVLSRASIMGNISLHLGNLSNLQYLDLSLNPSLAIHSLHFPSSLKYLYMWFVVLDKCDNWLQSINMLPSLLELELWNCELSIIGDVSHVNFTSLEVLRLDWNNFHSTIPSWLYNITKLQNLDLYSNAFRGSLSTDISNLNSLAYLNVGVNSLEGNMPNTLNRLCNLIELDLGNNKFSGEISGTFGNSSTCIKNSLENLSLLNNSFSGSIPDNLGQFKRLKVLYLSENSFWGSIPVSIGQLYNLERLRFSQNSLHGEVSELHLLNLRSLIELSMDGNSLVFDIDPEWIPPFQLDWIGLSSCEVGPSFPQWLKTQKSIRFLEMSNASISDNIPDWFENISSNIVGLDLSYNQLFGTLPTFRKLNTTYANEYRIILLKSNHHTGEQACSTSLVAKKGEFATHGGELYLPQLVRHYEW
ncbi:receptor-like protein 11 [Manihot esculenta]|uniref:receptor-like protein 11 n=1 Tax=Manihot esculenta TaxID=3983 RepID=UPI001CC44199|nr:receptor-like protein 11 [Manihot esculenta]